jgi:hypothetical protein
VACFAVFTGRYRRFEGSQSLPIHDKIVQEQPMMMMMMMMMMMTMMMMTTTTTGTLTFSSG